MDWIRGRQHGKNEVIYSEGIGVCRVSDIVNLSVNKKSPMIYILP